jgi:hypothetical protein
MANVNRPDTPRNRGDSDAPHMSPVTPAEDARTILINQISWGAVLAGVVVALVTQLILNMLGIGIGAATLDPGAGSGENPSVTSFSIAQASGGRSPAFWPRWLAATPRAGSPASQKSPPQAGTA